MATKRREEAQKRGANFLRGRRKRVLLIVILSAAKNPAGHSHPEKRVVEPIGFFAPRRLTNLFRRTLSRILCEFLCLFVAIKT